MTDREAQVLSASDEVRRIVQSKDTAPSQVVVGVIQTDPRLGGDRVREAIWTLISRGEIELDGRGRLHTRDASSK